MSADKISKNDDKIKELLAKVDEQQKGLGTKPRPGWITNGIFKYPDGNYFNLNTVQEAQPLVDALSFLLEKEMLQREASGRLGVEVGSFKWNEYATSDWEQDFKKRIEVLAWQKRKNQLDATKKKLKSLVSEETRTEMELSDIEQLLG